MLPICGRLGPCERAAIPGEELSAADKRDLSPAEMDAIAAAAPMKTYSAGELLFSPHNPVETLFILKRGRSACSASRPTAER